MITTDDELAVVRKQLAHCSAAIDSLRTQLLPDHERNFNLYAQPWIDLQQQFQADIDAYLNTDTRPRGDSSPRTEPTESTLADRI